MSCLLLSITRFFVLSSFLLGILQLLLPTKKYFATRKTKIEHRSRLERKKCQHEANAISRWSLYFLIPWSYRKHGVRGKRGRARPPVGCRTFSPRHMYRSRKHFCTGNQWASFPAFRTQKQPLSPKSLVKRHSVARILLLIFSLSKLARDERKRIDPL